MTDPYELFYWPHIPGRGELVRLALEDAGAPYVDVARSEAHGGVAALKALLRDRPDVGARPFAPPILRHGSLVLSQVGAILAYLGPRLGLAGEGGGHATLAVQLTISDLVSEVHDTHHPIGTSLYYEEQTEAARQRTATFLEHRLPKFLDYFERLVRENTDAREPRSLVGDHTYADLSMFHVLAGLTYAFPRAMAAKRRELPALTALEARVAARPHVAAYLASPRRIAFSPSGIFRAYPELDIVPSWAAGSAP
jgi:glutathione S-transferase